MPLKCLMTCDNSIFALYNCPPRLKDYLLFIDTEASGLPKNWKLPYSRNDNWPYAVQISWVIYTKGGKRVKQENFYIGNSDFSITPSATRVHGIDRNFLTKHGKDRRKVLKKLNSDLAKFKPLVLGHFMELDYHILGVDFFRSGIANPLRKCSSFCTMLATKHLVSNPSVDYLRLGELYTYLFNKKLENQHNAVADAEATAECFFELVRRGEITEEKIAEQQIKHNPTEPKTSLFDKVVPVLIIIVLLALLTAIIYG